MRAPDRKLRFALAVFAADVVLGPVVAALLREGIPFERIGLILGAASLRRIADTTLATDAVNASSEASFLVALADILQPLSEGSSSEQTLASPCLLDPWRSGSHLPALWDEAAPDGSMPRLAPDLERHVRSGSIILAVESLTPREQWRCMRVLLHQNSSSVLALECALPPSRSNS